MSPWLLVITEVSEAFSATIFKVEEALYFSVGGGSMLYRNVDKELPNSVVSPSRRPSLHNFF